MAGGVAAERRAAAAAQAQTEVGRLAGLLDGQPPSGAAPRLEMLDELVRLAGLTGMRDRVTACGGSLTCGPTAAGGWEVSALLPAS